MEREKILKKFESLGGNAHALSGGRPMWDYFKTPTDIGAFQALNEKEQESIIKKWTW